MIDLNWKAPKGKIPFPGGEYERRRRKAARVKKHYGPGPHPSGSPQAVHGLGGGGGASYEGNRILGDDGTVFSTIQMESGATVYTTVLPNGSWFASGDIGGSGDGQLYGESGGEESMLKEITGAINQGNIAGGGASSAASAPEAAPDTPSSSESGASSDTAADSAPTDSGRATSGKAPRPTSVNDIIGQDGVKQQLSWAMQRSKDTGAPLPHMVFTGPPGTGKTTLARAVANDMGRNLKVVTGPALKTREDVDALLMSLEENDILFIDEIHAVPGKIQEVLFPVMEDFEMDVKVGDSNVRMQLPPFTMIGATTNPEGMLRPMQQRFAYDMGLTLYNPDDLAQIATRTGSAYGLNLDFDTARSIALRSRGTPRIVNQYMAQLRDYAHSSGGNATPEMVDEMFGRIGVDTLGLTKRDRSVLSAISNSGGRMGLTALSQATGAPEDEIQEVIEPWLAQSGLTVRTPSGRIITEAGLAHLQQTAEFGKRFAKAEDVKPASSEITPTDLMYGSEWEGEYGEEEAEAEKTIADAKKLVADALARIAKHGDGTHDESSHGNRTSTFLGPAGASRDKTDNPNLVYAYGSTSRSQYPGVLQRSTWDEPGFGRISRKDRQLLRRWERWRTINPIDAMDTAGITSAFTRRERSRLRDLFNQTGQDYMARLIKSVEVKKHGRHDQKSHGNWARGGGSTSAPAGSMAALIKENERRLGAWERSSRSPTYDDPEVKAAANQLFQKALVNEARVSAVIVPVVEATGGEFHHFGERIKFEGSLRSKIVRTADEGAFTIEEAAANVRDLNRYTVAWEPDEWASGYEKFRAAMAEDGWRIYDSKEKNFWDPGDYYDGFNVQFTNGGSYVEVQFGTPRSLELKNRSHAIYTKVRDMDDTPERAKMMDEMYAIWHTDRSHVPPNVARLGVPQAEGF